MRDFLFAKDSPRNVRFYSSKRREGLMTTVCREYSGRTLVAIQAPSIAKIPAIGSKQCWRAFRSRSPALLCPTLSRFRRDNIDRSEHFPFPSGLPGRNHGQETIFLASIRTTGEIFRTGCSNYTLCRYFRAKVTEVYRKTW